LMDAIVDRYFAVLEAAGERINRLDEELTERPKSSTLRRIQSLKTELMRLRRNIWPVREVLGQLAAMPERRVSAYTKDYLRDTQEHTMEMLDMVEMYRDMLSTMVEVYLSSVSNKTNEVMKVLTVFGTVFMPLTFIVGIYGMNFRNLPELNWELGYYAVWAVMLAVTGVMLLYFKRKGWF
ncbi:MAG: magnesium/cobalt transporter CorA, partial [Patescibacteria group bacterium]